MERSDKRFFPEKDYISAGARVCGDMSPGDVILGIADITCDVEGSIECNVKTTDSGNPAYLCNPLDRSIVDGNKGEGIVLLAVDNLPAELPNDSSRFFSNQLKAFTANLVNADYGKPLKKSGLCPDIQRAVIGYKGELTHPYEKLESYVS